VILIFKTEKLSSRSVIEIYFDSSIFYPDNHSL